jgi:hypothetical protein
VNLQECSRLRRIAAFCFNGCGSLRTLSFPDSVASIHTTAFWSSGLEAVNLAHCQGLVDMGASEAHWLASLRLPFRLRRIDNSYLACRVADVSGGIWDMSALHACLHRFRSSASRGPGGGPSRCLVSARVTAELAAVGGRSSAPALPN